MNHWDQRNFLREHARVAQLATPRAVTVPLRHLNPATLGTKQERDQFADAMLQREREYEESMAGLPEQPLTEDDVDELAERYTEGRRHRMFHKHNPHD